MLRKDQISKLTECDITLTINLKVTKYKDFFLLTTSQLQTSNIFNELSLRLSISVHWIVEVEHTLGNKISVGSQNLSTVFQFTLVGTQFVEVEGNTLG